MLRLTSPSLCPFCEASAVAGRLLNSSWQSSRQMATLQKRRPSRMTLSPSVARGPPKAAPSGKPIRKSRNSPFGGMNVTRPPKNAEAPTRNVSAAEQKRASRGAPQKKEEPAKTKQPMKALKMQRALASVPYDKRTRVKQQLADRDTFAEFDLLPIVQEAIPLQALPGRLDVSPTPIQRLAIPALLGTEVGKRRRSRNPVEHKQDKQQYLLAAETGSGKTLAYVLPILDALKRDEERAAKVAADEEAAKVKRQASEKSKYMTFELEAPLVDEPHQSTGRPRAIVLVPTSELVNQVSALIKSLCHKVKLRSRPISASFSSTVIRNRLFDPAGIDIVVSTPHLLSSITEGDPNVLSRVTHLVIDEADSLLDRSFAPTTSSIIDRATPSLHQLVLCSATIPRSLDSYLHKRFPDIRRLVTPNLHAIPRRVQLSVVDIDKVPYQGNRDLACAQVIYDIGKEVSNEYDGEGELSSPEKKLVVFVNEREKATELAAYLVRKGIDAFAFSRDSDERKQAEILATFTGTGVLMGKNPKQQPHRATSSPSSSSSSQQLPNTKVLVTTDISSRGIDTLPVKTVLLYDVPHTSIDFIHRLGRVGRMGRRGRGIVLVGKGDRRDVVREVREGMFKGQALI